MALQFEFYVESSVQGYHEYFKNLTRDTCVGDTLDCEQDLDNEYDIYAIVIKTEVGETVGHVPLEVSKHFLKFLQNYGEIEAERIGCRFNLGGGKGLEIAVDYKFVGNIHYLGGGS
eukprot:gene16354-17999_t